MQGRNTHAAAPNGVAYETAGTEVGRLFDEHGRLVLGLCRMLLRDPAEAEDAAQQTFLSAYSALLGGTRPLDAAAWLATIARNECRGRIRKRMAAPMTAPIDDAEAPGDALDAVEQREELAALRSALRDLPERQREAIVLRELYGLSQTEVARAMDVAEASVESLLWRARRQLEQRRVLTGVSLGTLVVPGSLREHLARLIPGFPAAETAAVAAGALGVAGGSVPLVAKLVAAVVVATTATTVTVERDRIPLPSKTDTPVARAAAHEAEDDRSGRGRGSLDDSSGRGSGRDVEVEDRSGRSGGDDGQTRRNRGGDGRSGSSGGGEERRLEEDRSGSGSGSGSSGSSGSGSESGAEEVSVSDPDDSSGSGSGSND